MSDETMSNYFRRNVIMDAGCLPLQDGEDINEIDI